MMNKWLKFLLSDGWAILGLGLLMVVFFYRTIFLGLWPIPSDALVGRYHPWVDALRTEYPRGVPYKNFLITDPVRQQIPWRKLVVEQNNKGEKPGWNPFSFGGMPLDLNVQAAAFYPLNQLFKWWPFIEAWSAIIMSQMLGMTIFTYIYLRTEKLTAEAALVGAIIAGMSGFVVAWLEWGTMVSALMWLPLILAVIRLWSDNRGWLKKAGLIMVMAVSVLGTLTAGHIQITLYVLLVAGSYYLYQLKVRKDKSLWLLGIATGLMIGGFGARYFGRLFGYLATTVRGSSSTMWQEEGFFIPLKHLVQFFVPDFYGNPGTFNYWSTWNYGELIGYIGMAGVILAIAGGIWLWKRQSFFWPMLVVISFLLALNTPLAWIPYWLKVPYWSSLQPTRLLAVIDFSLAVMAAYGYEHLVKMPGSIRLFRTISNRVASLMVLVLLVAVGLGFKEKVWMTIALRNMVIPTVSLAVLMAIVTGYWWLWKKKIRGYIWLRYFIVVVLTADLVRFGWKFLPFTPTKFFYPKTEVISYLQQQPQPFRTMSLNLEVAPTNTLTWYGIEEIGGYNPVYSDRYARYFNALENGLLMNGRLQFQRLFDPTEYNSKLAKYMDVKYVFSTKAIEDPKASLVINEGDTYLYEIEGSPGRWYMAGSLRVYDSGNEVLEAMLKSEPDTQPAYVEEPVESLHGTGVITQQIYSPNRQELSVSVNEEGFLVNSTAWDTNWQAYVDGVETQVYRTNYLFMGIKVPKGDHRVSFVYE